MELVFFRLFPGVIAIVLGAFLTELNLSSVVFAFSLTHNLLAFVYSNKQRIYLKKNFARHGTSLTYLLVAFLLSGTLYGSSVYFLFAIHHICNETYFAQNKFKYSSKNLALSRAFFHTVIFCIVTRSALESSFGLVASSKLWMGFLAWSGGLFLYQMKLNANHQTKYDLSFEFVSLFFAAFSLATKSGSLLLVMIYHVCFWTFYPAASLKQQGGATRFYGLNLIFFSLSLLITPMGFKETSLSLEQMSHAIRIMATFHIFTSMALSYSHPLWIRKLFFANPNREVEINPTNIKIEREAA